MTPRQIATSTPRATGAGRARGMCTTPRWATLRRTSGSRTSTGCIAPGCRGRRGDTMSNNGNMEQHYCDRCHCIQWMFTWIEETWRGRFKFFECPDCGRVVREKTHDKREHEKQR